MFTRGRQANTADIPNGSPSIRLQRYNNYSDKKIKSDKKNALRQKSLYEKACSFKDIGTLGG